MIRIESLDFKYYENPILKNISLQVHQGEILCLLGPNGSGKTTLLKCLLGIHACTSGQIYMADKLLESYSHKKLARYVSYVPQKQTSSFPYRVIDMVVMGRTSYLGILDKPSKKDYQIALEALQYVGLEKLSERPYTELSGGESQLVMIARALTQESECIILDEPTAHLDYRNELLILETIKALVKDQNRTIVMATHYPNHALYFENHGIETKVAFLNEGGIEISGKPTEVLTEKNLSSIYNIESKIIIHDHLSHIVPLKTKRR